MIVLYKTLTESNTMNVSPHKFKTAALGTVLAGSLMFTLSACAGDEAAPTESSTSAATSAPSTEAAEQGEMGTVYIDLPDAWAYSTVGTLTITDTKSKIAPMKVAPEENTRRVQFEGVVDRTYVVTLDENEKYLEGSPLEVSPDPDTAFAPEFTTNETLVADGKAALVSQAQASGYALQVPEAEITVSFSPDAGTLVSNDIPVIFDGSPGFLSIPNDGGEKSPAAAETDSFFGWNLMFLGS